MDNQNKELTEQLNNVNTNLDKLKKYVSRLDNLLNHLGSIDDSLKTLAWVQSATLSMNEENMKKLNDTTTKMISSFSALSQSDDNSSNDKNNVPEDALVYSNDIKKEGNGDES
jgi:hypothetical protein